MPEETMRLIKDKPWIGSPQDAAEAKRLYDRDRARRLENPFWTTLNKDLTYGEKGYTIDMGRKPNGAAQVCGTCF